MQYTEQIKENFNKGYFGMAMKIDGLPDEYPAWTLKQSDWIGVAVPLRDFFEFSEKFSKVQISTEESVLINDVMYDLLLIRSTDMESRNEFAAVCSNFVDPGKDGETRNLLTEKPEIWWEHWKSLIGNVSTEKRPYDILGELLMVEKLLQDGKNPRWTGVNRSTHDIEADGFSVEMKSTVKRYGSDVKISSIYQLNPPEDSELYLSFIRFEQSDKGENIDTAAKRLKVLGYDEAELESALERSGLEKGRVARNEKYRILEWKLYHVDDSFPKLNEHSFKNDRIPPNISGITYNLDLSGIPGENLL